MTPGYLASLLANSNLSITANVKQQLERSRQSYDRWTDQLDRRAYAEFEGRNNLAIGTMTWSGGTLSLTAPNIAVNATGSANLNSIGSMTTSYLMGLLVHSNLTINASANGSDPGDITVAQALSWTGNSSLTLNAANNINATNAPISWSGTGVLTMNANSTTGAITFSSQTSGVPVTWSNGQLVLNAPNISIATAGSLTFDNTTSMTPTYPRCSSGEFESFHHRNTGSEPGNLTIGSSINWTSAHTLSLTAGNTLAVDTMTWSGGTLTLNAPNIVVNTSGSAGLSGIGSMTTSYLENLLVNSNVTINASANGGDPGNITADVPFTWSSNKSLTLTSANTFALNNAITAPNGSLTLNAPASTWTTSNLAALPGQVNVGALTVGMNLAGSGSVGGSSSLVDPNIVEAGLAVANVSVNALANGSDPGRSHDCRSDFLE